MRPFLAFLLLLAPACSAVAAEMRVHFIDVGQGAATLLEFDCGCALVDTGGENTSSYGFNSTENLTEYLNQFFLHRPDLNRTIDVLYLTHPHIDHTRGAKEVWKNYQVRNLVTNGSTKSSSGSAQQKWVQDQASSTEETDTLTDDIGYRGVRVEDISANGLTDAVIDPLHCGSIDPVFTVLWGSLGAKPNGWTKKEFENENNHSVVLRVDYGSSSMLIPGDIEEEAIGQLVTRYANTHLLDVDVAHMAHHGSKNGATLQFLQSESPAIAVFACGDVSREGQWTAWAYGHPNSGVIGMLQAQPSMLNRTPIQVMAGNGARKFGLATISKAIYSSGWDGGVVMTTAGDGHWVIGTASAPVSNLINVNTASQQELESLPGIGETRAKAIIKWRTDNGNIDSFGELDQVSGIGPTTIEALRNRISF